MKTYLIFTFSIVLSIAGCHRNEQPKDLLLNENEFCVNNEKLASISKDGNTYFIGTESSGRIYEYSEEKNAIVDSISVNCGRIYHVKLSPESPNTYWLGIQNMGLQKYIRQGDSLILNTAYTIKGKETRYSCYECYIDTASNMIYAMTSHGVFCVVPGSKKLQPIYPKKENESPEPMVATNMVKGGDFLFASTATGLMRVPVGSNETKSYNTTLTNKNITNINLHNDTIFALANNKLYKCNLTGEPVDSININPAKIYYYSNGIHYFLAENDLTLAHDSTLKDITKHKIVPLRRKLSINSQNIIADSKNFSLLVAGNVILKIGHHLPSVFCEVNEGGAKLACTDGKSIYYYAGNKIYKLEEGSTIATEIVEVKDKGDIRFIECSSDGQSLYFVNTNDEIYCRGLNHSWWEIRSHAERYIEKSNKPITAICSSPSDSGLILGVRDGLVGIDGGNKEYAISLIYNEKETCEIPYISRFTVSKSDSSFMVPTMNDGLFYGKGTKLQLIPNTRNLQSIRDVAFSSDNTRPYILTNKHILNLSKDSVFNNNNFSSRILALDSCSFYFPGEVSGVRRILLDKYGNLVSDSTLFPDISFKPESSMVLNGSVYLGGASGVIVINESNDNKTTWNYVKFKDTKVPNAYILLSVFFTILLLIVIIDRYRLGKRALQTYKKGLIMRIDELKTVEEFLDSDTRLQLENLMTEIESIDVSGRKNALLKIREISKRIMEHTEIIPSSLTNRLREQMRQIEDTHFADTPSYIDSSNEAIKIHTLLRLGGQIRTNAQWLYASLPLVKKYADYKARFKEIVAIPQVTDNILEIINSSDAHDIVVKKVDNHLKDLDTDEESKTIINEYFTGQIEKAKKIQSYFEKGSDHYLLLKEIIKEYMNYCNVSTSEAIIKFPLNDNRLRIMDILRSVSKEVSDFRSNYEKYQALDDKLNAKNGYALLREDDKAKIRKQDEETRKKHREDCTKNRNMIKNYINDFYVELKKVKDQQLIDYLNLGQKKGKGQFMWEEVLALLIAGVDYDYDFYGEVLVHDASRIRDAKSDIQGAIAQSLTSIVDYAEDNLSSIAILIMNLDNPHKNKDL